MHLSTDITYRPSRRPACVVEHAGEWYAGEIELWRRRPDGWWATVSYLTAYDRAFLELLPSDRVRPLGTPDQVWEDPPAASSP